MSRSVVRLHVYCSYCSAAPRSPPAEGRRKSGCGSDFLLIYIDYPFIALSDAAAVLLWTTLTSSFITNGVRLRHSALPLPPSLLSHRSPRCFGICSPNHNCDTGQSHTQTHARSQAQPRVDFQTFTRNRLGVIYFSQAFLNNSRCLSATVDYFVLWVNVPYSDWSEWISCPHWLEELVVEGRATVILLLFIILHERIILNESRWMTRGWNEEEVIYFQILR